MMLLACASSGLKSLAGQIKGAPHLTESMAGATLLPRVDTYIKGMPLGPQEHGWVPHTTAVGFKFKVSYSLQFG